MKQMKETINNDNDNRSLLSQLSEITEERGFDFEILPIKNLY